MKQQEFCKWSRNLHITKLNEQNSVKTIKKLEYFNRDTDEILATDDLENVTEHCGLMRQLYKESQDIVRKVQQLKIEADLPTEIQTNGETNSDPD